MINARVVYDHVTPKLRSLVRDPLRAKLVMEAIGEHLANSTRERFLDTKTDPDGVPWTPNAETTVAKKGHDDILIDTETLAQSPDYDVVGMSSVVIGHAYNFPTAPGVTAAIHQLGGVSGRNYATKIPQRAFFGVSDDDVSAIERILDVYMQ